MSDTKTAPAPHLEKFDATLIGVAVIVILGSFMSLLDSTIVNVAIDTLSTAFDATLSQVQWVTTGYLLALAAVIPLTGWASDRFGTKRVYLVSIAVFTAASVLAGLAWNLESLIGFRVLQGLGGGMIMPAGMTLIARTAGHHRVGRAMSIVGVPMLLGPVLGPVLGGWLVEATSWRWIFFINAPIGLAAVVLGLWLLPRETPQRSQRIDWVGVLLLSPGLVGVLYGLSQLETGGLGSLGTLAPLLAGLLLIGGFVWHALRTAQPLIDLRLLGRGAMAASSTSTALLAVAFNGMMFLLPLYFQVARGLSPAQTGLLVAPLGVGAAATTALIGRLTDRMPAGRVVLVGMIPFLAGTIGMTALGADTPLWLVSIFTLLIGVGAGATQMPIMTAGLQTIDGADTARANTVLNIMARAGASIGVAVVALVLAGNLPGGSVTTADPSAATANAFADTFWWSVAFTLIAAAGALFLPRRRPREDKIVPAAVTAD